MPAKPSGLSGIMAGVKKPDFNANTVTSMVFVPKFSAGSIPGMSMPKLPSISSVSGLAGSIVLPATPIVSGLAGAASNVTGVASNAASGARSAISGVTNNLKTG